MKYFRLLTTNPYYNLAVEEYLFENSTEDVIILWQNEPSVVVGINQNIRAEVDMAALSRHKVHPVRRITGGGAVYHDLGNVNYTFISNASGGIDFATFSRPIVDALASLGVRVTLSGRNDLCLIDQRKISGNAQCKRGTRILHHGTLLFDTDLDALGNILTPSPEKLASKAIKSTRSRVANLKELLPGVSCAEELIIKIEEYIITVLGAEKCRVEDNTRIQELSERNSSDEWLYPTRGISAGLEAVRERRFPFGTVKVKLSLLGKIISDVEISGDFFGEKNIGELEAQIKGRRIDKVKEELSGMNIGDYILGMTEEDLASLLCDI